jgi:uncharacterized UBP type Zn finger protein
VAIACTHLDQVTAPRPAEVEGCDECLRTGMQWVHLRVCRSCGRVGCCDSSPGRHASAHARESEHPIITSLQPGEDWSYCFVDGEAFVIAGDAS